MTLVEREGRDGCGGVLADAWQGQQLFVGVGHPATVCGDDLGRGGVKP